jgi:hypothetical protein
MDLNEKINIITTLYNKAFSDNNYKITVDWKGLTSMEIQTYLANCKQFLNTMDNLDYDVRQQGIANWHAKMDMLLSMFPEYQNMNEEENRKVM